MGKHLRCRRQALEDSVARCNFFALSPELRNRIYKLLVCASADPERERKAGEIFSKEKRFLSFVKDCIDPQLHQPAITRVGRATRAESMPMFYGLNEYLVVNQVDYFGSIGYEMSRQ